MPTDYIKECLSGQPNPSISEFEAAFCSRCIQKECNRSLAGRSKFEARIANWEQKLFTNPATLPTTDPRYAVIAAKHFKDMGDPNKVSLPVLGRASVGEWASPVAAPPATAQPVTPPKKTRKPKAKKEEAQPEATQAAPPPAPLPQPPQAPRRTNNTAFQQGAMLGGAPAGTPAQPPPPKDPWAAPAPVDKNATVVKPGGKFRFGS